MEKLHKYIDDLQDYITDFRRDFHKYPEVGWAEMRTASIIIDELKSLGFEVQFGKDVLKEESRMGLPKQDFLDKNYARAKEQINSDHLDEIRDGFTAVVGIMRFGHGPTVGMRFDMDALNIGEPNSEDHFPSREGFRSLHEGIMHACGHDGHTSIGLGVAKAISDNRETFKSGTIKLIFQPAEEGVRGGKSMAESGILDDVDYIIAGHLITNDDFGKLICNNDGFLATSKMDVEFMGVPAHAGGAPNEGKNSLLAAATSVLNLNAIPRHKKGTSRINVGSLICEGDRNIIPELTRMKIETRGETSEINEYMKNYAESIIKGSALMHDVDYKIDYAGEAIVAAGDDEMAEVLSNIGSKIAEITEIQLKSDSPFGSEDYTFMMDKVQKNGGKATFFTIGAARDGNKMGLHTKNFDFDERVLPLATKIFVSFFYEFTK